MCPTTAAPGGWLVCDGSAVSRSTYASLYAVIGTGFGSGDGSTTFNLPNFKGRIPAGYDISQTEFNSIGKIGGEKTHLQTVQEMPTHTHTGAVMSDGMRGWGVDGGISSGTTGAAGGGSAFNVLNPYFTINYIIKY